MIQVADFKTPNYAVSSTPLPFSITLCSVCIYIYIYIYAGYSIREMAEEAVSV